MEEEWKVKEMLSRGGGVREDVEEGAALVLMGEGPLRLLNGTVS